MQDRASLTHAIFPTETRINRPLLCSAVLSQEGALFEKVFKCRGNVTALLSRKNGYAVFGTDANLKLKHQ